MSGYILCQTKRAKLPYFIENISTNVYSIEELSYYLYHNLYLIDQTIMNEGLCSWIQEELELPALAAKLRSKISKFASAEDIVYPVFKEINYLTYEELKDREEYQAWLDSGGTIAFPEGEEQKEFRSRCVRGMLCQVDRLCKENVESVAFVVHGGTIMAVLEQLAEDQKDFYHWQVENGRGYRMLVDEEEWKSGVHRFYEIQKLGGAIE